MRQKKVEGLKRFLHVLQLYLHRRKASVALILVAIAAVTMFAGFFRMLMLLSLLLVLNVLISTAALQLGRYSTGIELIMLTTVVSGMAYGSKAGAIVGIIASVLYYYGAGRFSYFIIIFAPLYALCGIAAGYFIHYSVFQVGMACTIAYTVISSILVTLIFNAKLDKTLVFALINTPFNFIMFKYLAPLFLMVA